MWNELIDEAGIKTFMTTVNFFHDSCIKEIKYLSGAYVDNELAMYPINETRSLNVIIQRQDEDFPMIEMKFEGLKYLKMYPLSENFTCEILNAVMYMVDGAIYWCDSDELSVDNIELYEGTLICAKKCFWRIIENCMGQDTFYPAIK